MKQSLACFVLGRRSYRVGIILIINKERIVTDFNCSDPCDITMTIYTLESMKVHLFALQNTIIIELLTWFFVVELALKQANLIIKGLKLVIEGTT